MEPSLTSWTVLFLIAAAHGLFLSVMIFLRKSKANNLLAFLILCFSLCLLFYVAFWTHYTLLLPKWIGLLQGLTYCLGPLLYFYIRSDRKKVYFSPGHFLPFVLFIFLYESSVYFPDLWTSSIGIIQAIIQTAHLVIYTLMIFHYVNTHKAYHNGACKVYLWRNKLAIAFSGYTLSFLIYYVLVWTGALIITYDYIISIASSFFIYFIGYSGFQQPEVLRAYETGKYERSSLSDRAAQAILKEVKQYMLEKQAYLDSNLKLTQVADQLQFSIHHISQAINDLEGKNFTDYVNELRINDAKRRLLTSEDKIIHIAYDSGFNNKTSFNNTFKKFTGLSPSEFRTRHMAASA